jgi:hypothetical protein
LTLRLALRSLLARPVRSAVLACGFGFGIAVMAALLGVGEVILEQARSPALLGGGDLIVSGPGGSLPNAAFVLAHVLGSEPLKARVRAASPAARATVYLLDGGAVVPIEARGGVPSLERALGDPELAPVTAWADPATATAWIRPDPADLLRSMDRFHPVPDVRARQTSWAEWLYFNGRTADGTARFYLTFLVGPPAAGGRRTAGVRLQLDHCGGLETFSRSAVVDAAEVLARAPDLDIAGSRVRLDGLDYRLTLDLDREGGGEGVTADLVLRAVPGRSVPPFELRGAGGWVSGYTVPVLAGALAGRIEVGGTALEFAGGAGYHDHNWGFWEGVTWRWGQVAGDGVSVVYGRVRPPADAADPDRVPGFVAVLGSEGPLGFSSRPTIAEDAAADGSPGTIRVAARDAGFDLRVTLDVESTTRTALGGPFARRAAGGSTFLQMRGPARVVGRVAGRTIDFTAPGAAETFVVADE